MLHPQFRTKDRARPAAALLCRNQPITIQKRLDSEVPASDPGETSCTMTQDELLLPVGLSVLICKIHMR